jgi:aspartate kinase
MIEQSGFLARVLDAFEVNVTDIDMVSTSEASISLTIKDTKMLNAIMAELKEMDPSLSIKVMENRSIVCVVGEGMRHATGTSGRLFSALGKARINVEAISQGASEINMTFVVSDEDASKAIQTVHNEFFRSKSDYMDDEEGIVIKGQ